MATNIKVTQDWDRDGYLKIENAQTLNRYSELKSELSNHEYKGIGFAFTREQLQEVLAKLRPQLKDGEKIINFSNGGFATPEGYQEMLTFLLKKDLQDFLLDQEDLQEKQKSKA